MQLLTGIHNVHQLLQEPTVYLCQLMYLVYGISGTKGFGDDKDTFIRRLTKCFVNIGDDKFLILHKAMHPLSYHAQPFLNDFLKGTSDSHNLSDRLHA